MDSVLRQSKAMCPFLKKASPATLRALSTTTRPQVASTAVAVSPCGGTMSKLQLYAQRCPIMGKAMAVQSAKINAGAPTFRAFSGQAKSGKAKIHTSSKHEAQPLDRPLFEGARDQGTLN